MMDFTTKLAIFIISSVGIIWVSRSSVREIRSHGFYRFLAWECMLLLIIENLEHWFENPFSLIHIFSWIFLFSSIAFLFWGLQSLRSAQRSAVERNDSSLYEFEQTIELVTTGIFKYIRHPMYSSLLLLAVGTFLKNVTFLTIILILMSTFFLFMTAVMEEKENLTYFGEPYKNFMAKTRRFIPFLF